MVILCLLSGVAGGVVVRLTIPAAAPPAAATLEPVATVPPETPRDTERAPAPPSGSVTAVAEKAKPSVVAISRGSGAGSGVIISPDGLIITNAHVVGEASNVDVRLADGTQLRGQVLGRDPEVDVAVVQVDRTGLPAADLGSALDLRSGDPVVAVGNPLGLEGSVSAGVVSALGRYVPGEDGALRAAIQTDAAINPGNSGGALLDLSGRVIGITTAKAGGGIDNIGFAIPIDVARAIAADLAAGHQPSHPFLGIAGAEVDAATARALGSPVGARVESVESGTPADIAGLQPGDVIVALDGETVESLFDLSVTLATRRAGDTVAIELADGRTLTTTLVERPR